MGVCNDGVIISLQELSFSVRVIYPFAVRSRNCLFTAVRLMPAASASCRMVLLGCSYIRFSICHITARFFYKKVYSNILF